jgi:HAD superfamily hydrolase (TIGR01509 family)
VPSETGPLGGVLFDFVGTIFDDVGVLDPARVVAKAQARGVELDAGAAADFVTATLAFVDAPERAAAKVGSDLSSEAHRRVWTDLIRAAGTGGEPLVQAYYDCLTDNDSWYPYPDTAATLEALSTAGVKVGVVSNIGWDIRPAIARAVDPARLDAVVLSCEVGLEKPDPAIYALGCERLGLDPGEVVFVGDDPLKDGGAVRAGLSAYILSSRRNVGRPRGLDAVLRLLGMPTPPSIRA